MKKEMKQVRLYLPEPEAEIIENLAASLGQTESWILSTLAASALHAVRDNGLTFPMPLRFQLEGGEGLAARARPKEAALPKRKAA